MAEPMTTDEWHSFVSEGTRTGMLGVTRADGRPHVTPVWFVLDDDGDLHFTTATAGLKGRAIARDGRVCLTVDDPHPPYAFVKIEGRATLGSDPDALLRWATAAGIRYMGAERGEEFGRRNSDPAEESTVTIHPTGVVAFRGVSD